MTGISLNVKKLIPNKMCNKRISYFLRDVSLAQEFKLLCIVINNIFLFPQGWLPEKVLGSQSLLVQFTCDHAGAEGWVVHPSVRVGRLPWHALCAHAQQRTSPFLVGLGRACKRLHRLPSAQSLRLCYKIFNYKFNFRFSVSKAVQFIYDSHRFIIVLNNNGSIEDANQLCN